MVFIRGCAAVQEGDGGAGRRSLGSTGYLRKVAIARRRVKRAVGECQAQIGPDGPGVE